MMRLPSSQLACGSFRGIFPALALLTGTALAQTAPPAQVTAGHSEDALEEIIVTARKRSEVMQNIPESIQAFGEQELADTHFTKLDDLGGLVSNLNITTRSDNNPDVVLRGVGSFGVVQGVGFYANDVQLFDGQTVRPEDLERIEVLKGPQGTLYGGNNIGGAIKYITKLPTDKFEGEVAAEAGNYNTQTYSAVVSGALVPGVLDGRMSVFDSKSDGFIYNTILNENANKGRERGGRITLLYTSDATTATLYLNGDWNRSGAGANLYYRPPSQPFQDPASADAYTLNVTDGTRPSYSRELLSATFKLEHEFAGNVTLTSLSSYFHSFNYSVTDTDKGPIPFATGIDHVRHNVGSQEVRLANSDAGPFQWLIGLFGQINNNDIAHVARSFNGDPGNPAQFTDPTLFSDQFTDPLQRHNEYAAFGNASYHWNQWTFEAGLRADYNNSSMTESVSAYYPAAPQYPLAGEQHGTEVLPKFSASYHFSTDIMAYSTISRGFEPGDFVEDFNAAGNPFVAQFKPETTWNYEAGVKSTLFDRVRLNAAVFYIQYKDRLFQTNVFQGGQLIGVTENVGDSHNYGGEFEVSTRLTQELFVSGNFGVTKAVWGNIPWFDPDLGATAPPCPDGKPLAPAGCPTNLKGRTATNTPSYQGSLSLDWSHHLTGSLVFGARADASFVGYSFWDVTDHFRQNPYQIVNLGVRLEGGRWTVSGHVSNVFDKLYNTAFITSPELQAPFGAASVSRPRLWTAAVSYHW
ncbi:MAG TPA: TonB-dependent receptor [Steroidobacteraceae bacterium]|nr:TonB-dependent receptor [Steroidobacteraceae bacterium]